MTTTDSTPPPKRVSLALGSGGARGYAHIGALQVIEERGYEIASIAGSSMGALVGGLYAAGKLDEFTERAVALRQVDVLRLLDVSFTSPGAMRAEKVFSVVRELLDGARIEQLPIPFTAVATDLISRREVWFQQGPLEVAIRASISLPGVFTPVMLNGRLLVDGGLMDPIPVAPTAAVASDATIAISLAGDPHGPAGSTTAQETTDPRPVDEWIDRFRRGTSQMLDSDLATSLLAPFRTTPGDPPKRGRRARAAAAAAVSPVEALPPGLSTLEVMNQSLEAMQALVTRFRLAAFPPDLLIAIPQDACRTMDYHRAAPLIELGRTLTTQALDEAGL